MGTVVKFSTNAFQKLNGDAVSGTVDIKLMRSMIGQRCVYKTTHEWQETTTAGIETLVSGGEFYVNATQDGIQLKLVSGYNIVAPTANTRRNRSGDGIV
jgi:hypothetical protein